jgi:hypothetical protein
VALAGIGLTAQGVPMRSYTNLFAAVVVGVGALAAQPLIGQQKPAAQTRPAPATTAKPATTTTTPAAAPRAKTSNNPPAWWYLGKTDEDDMLFMDAANLVEQDGGDFITFRAFYYYGQPRVTTTTANGARATIAYEKVEAWMGCVERELSDERQTYFTTDDKEVAVEPTYEDMMKLEATRAGAAEYAFVCGQERAGGAHKFERVLTDPLTYVRKKK